MQEFVFKKTEAVVVAEEKLTDEEKRQAFIRYSAEADLIAKRGDFHTAILGYTQALVYKPADRTWYGLGGWDRVSEQMG